MPSPRTADSNNVDLFDEFEHTGKSNAAPPAQSCLFMLGSTARLLLVVEGNDEESAPEANFQAFPSVVPTLTKRFTNQDQELNNNGYDSNGNLPHCADKNYNDMEGYAKDVFGAIDNPPPPSVPVAVAAPALMVELVMKLLVKELKEELKKRGRAITEKKPELQDCLKEAVWLNVPVADPLEEARHESMAGLDMTAKWVPLTW